MATNTPDEEKKVKKSNKHVHSTEINSLQQRIMVAEKELKKLGVYYDYPEDVNEKDDRQLKFRVMRTKGNTKNQRKTLKKQHYSLLEATAIHLENIILKNQGKKPSRTKRSKHEEWSDSEESSSSDDEQ
jgi:hypothetical protein